MKNYLLTTAFCFGAFQAGAITPDDSFGSQLEFDGSSGTLPTQTYDFSQEEGIPATQIPSNTILQRHGAGVLLPGETAKEFQARMAEADKKLN